MGAILAMMYPTTLYSAGFNPGSVGSMPGGLYDGNTGTYRLDSQAPGTRVKRRDYWNHSSVLAGTLNFTSPAMYNHYAVGAGSAGGSYTCGYAAHWRSGVGLETNHTGICANKNRTYGPAWTACSWSYADEATVTATKLQYLHDPQVDGPDGKNMYVYECYWRIYYDLPSRIDVASLVWLMAQWLGAISSIQLSQMPRVAAEAFRRGHNHYLKAKGTEFQHLARTSNLIPPSMYEQVWRALREYTWPRYCFLGA